MLLQELKQPAVLHIYALLIERQRARMLPGRVTYYNVFAICAIYSTAEAGQAIQRPVRGQGGSPALQPPRGPHQGHQKPSQKPSPSPLLCTPASACTCTHTASCISPYGPEESGTNMTRNAAEHAKAESERY